MQLIARRPFEIAVLAAWTAYYLLMALGSFQSSYSNFWLAIAYQVSFVGIVILIYAALPKVKARSEDGPSIIPLAAVGLIVSAAAIISLFLSKKLAGIDYSIGLCYARNQMGQLGRQGTILSAFGNIFSYAFFVPVVAAISGNVGRRIFWTVMGISFAFLMALSIVTASRSTLLLFVGFSAAAVCIRLVLGRGIPRIKVADIACVVGILAAISFFIGSVFACRVDASHISTKQYQVSFQKYMGMEGEYYDDSLDENLKSQASGLVGMTVLYLVHSAYTFDGILSLPDTGDGQILFQYPRELLARAGLVTPPEDWILSGRFSSVPGALYHDYGIAGLLAGSAFLGVLSWAAATAVRRFQSNVAVTGAAAAVFTIIFLSPLHPAEEFMSFPFICFLFVAIPAFAHLFSNGRREHALSQQRPAVDS